MSYQDQLSPWAIYRQLPSLQRQLIQRFRQRNHAEAYLRAMQRLQPHAEFEIVYEVNPDATDATTCDLRDQQPHLANKKLGAEPSTLHPLDNSEPQFNRHSH